ncbi:MAG: DNA topoisomerase III [Clostridiales bacterium]|jgi:DNA topoisomerase-3|nr:DNA topoisomerase III [Clostridiales bacterium]
MKEEKKLVLAEKPSVARDIAKVLKCGKKGEGYFEGEKYLVTWALGHLVTLAEPDGYDKKYKQWRLEDLPMLPDRMKLVVIGKTAKQFNTVKEQMSRQDVGSIIIATDAGREGELVARWIIEKAGIKKPIQRLWISSVTDKAIAEGFSKLKPGAEYENLYASAEARAEADWIVGINATRALTCKYNAQLSCGRVQTPTLAMLEKREEDIQNFKPKTFYGLKAIIKCVSFSWQNPVSKDGRNYDKTDMESTLNSIKDKQLKVTEISQALKKTNSPGLYNLTELQRDANKLYDFGAKETLDYMQSLYEKHKVLTYPRTDSRYLSDDITDTLKDRVKACGIGQFAKVSREILAKPIIANKSFVDGSKVTDHHAIIPTEQTVILSDMSSGERKIYELAVKRFLSVLMPPYQYEQTTIKARIGKEIFTAKGRSVKELGWKSLYSESFEEEEDTDSDQDEQNLPEFKVNQEIKVDELKLTEGKTEPPKYFTEAALLSAMENPTKFMEGAGGDLLKTIGESGGLGTVATRADIIDKLYNTFLMEKKGKEVHITAKGKQLLQLVPEELRSPVLTAKWEQQLTAISKGTLGKKLFIEDMRKYSLKTVSEIKTASKVFKHDNITGEKCPQCGKFLLSVNGKKGKMLVCQDRECGYRKSVSQNTNARCPQCHKKLELKGEGEGRIFVCSCGFREKLSVFNARQNGYTREGSKYDINKYISENNKNNEKERLKDNPFAEAMKLFNQNKD